MPPRGRLATFGWAPDFSIVNRLILVNTDGTGRKTLLTTPGHGGSANPVWTPDGASVIISEEVPPANVTLILVDTAGQRRTFLTLQASFTRSFQPAPSRQLVYFTGSLPTGETGVWRAQPDGTGATAVFPAVQPGPSPDGSRVAYLFGETIRIRDIASGADSPVATLSGAAFPRWAPAGDLIAFTANGVRVINADGSGPRLLGDYGGPLSWSPDAQWIAAAGHSGGIVVIRVADGLVLPIAGTSDLYQPGWRPN